MEYKHQIDDLVIDAIRKYGSMNPTKIRQLLIKAYNLKISPTTVQKHLDKLTNTDLLERSKVKRRNNEQSYCLTDYAKRQLDYYGKIEPVISKRENRGGKRSKEESEDKVIDDEIVENTHIIFLNLLLQAADGSGRLEPVSREKLSGEIDLPVFFKREEGVTVQDIVESRDVGTGRIFSHIKFTMPMVQKCIDVLEKKYGIDIEKHGYANANNTLEEYSAPAGSQPDDLVKRVERIKVKDIGGNDDEIGVAIKDDNLRRLVNNIACLIFIVADRIKYTWLFKRKPRINSWEFNWHTTFFGRDKTLELIERSKHTLPSLKNEGSRQNLQDYIIKNVENYWNGIGREDIDPTLIDNDIQHEFEVILCKKENVDSLLQQTDRRIKNLYYERIKCEKYERIYCDQDHDEDDDKCEKCQKFHDEYEEYHKFAKDVVTNRDNKSNALIFPLIEIVYPRKLMKLHENQDKRRN